MCCLFGLIDYGQSLSGRQKARIVAALAAESEVRGTDAAGIAYNSGGKLHIYKRPGPAHKLRFFIPNDVHVVMGHSRLTTQGNAKSNQNNHPFLGKVSGMQFALAHNGVLYNDRALRRARKLPKTNIQTDSYIAVQLIEQEKALTSVSLRKMAEAVEGSFVFTVLDDRDDIYFVKGDNPLCLLQFPHLGLYVYASTELILRQAVHRTWLAGEYGREVSVNGGEIMRIDRKGSIQTQSFKMRDDFFPLRSHWGYYGSCLPSCGPEQRYLRELKSVAAAFGYEPEMIDTMLRDGWSTDEIEEALYDRGSM